LRRCIVTGVVRPKAELLRFVVSPDGVIVPDIARRLPGRGLWLTARRDIVAAAVGKRLFGRVAKGRTGLQVRNVGNPSPIVLGPENNYGIAVHDHWSSVSLNSRIISRSWRI